MDHRSIAAGRYQVSGMTCDHCVAAITEEVGALDGVTGVEVDLAAGDLTVHSSRVVSTDDVAAALAQAGYDLVHGARRGSDMTTSAATDAVRTDLRMDDGTATTTPVTVRARR